MVHANIPLAKESYMDKLGYGQRNIFYLLVRETAKLYGKGAI